MIYGYSTERVGGYFTHVICLDEEIIKSMSDNNFRSDNGVAYGSQTFFHLTKQTRDEFLEEYDIILVDSKNELKMLKKIVTGY